MEVIKNNSTIKARQCKNQANLRERKFRAFSLDIRALLLLVVVGGILVLLFSSQFGAGKEPQLIFKEARQWQIAADAIAYTELAGSFAPTAAGAWTDYDIYTNKSIPKGAIVEIAACNSNTLLEAIIGVRTDGSALSRSLSIHEAEGDGQSCTTFFVRVDSGTGIIEYYASATTSIIFGILGYWTGVDFTEEWSAIAAGGASAWEDETLSTANAVYAITAKNANTGGPTTVGVRANGSALNRYVVLHESEGAAGSTGLTAYTMIVKSDASKIIDIYTSSTTNGTFNSQGYFDSTMDFVEKWSQKDVAVAVTWTDFDLTAEMDQDRRVAFFFISNSAAGVQYNMGVRTNRSGLARYINIHESEGVGAEYNGFTASALTDASGIVELYTGIETADYHWFAGYFKPIAITVSGTAYTDEIGTILASSGGTIKLVNNTTGDTFSDADGTDASGIWTISADLPSVGDILTIWINGATADGTLVLEYGATCGGYPPNCTGLSIYQNRVILRSENDNSLSSSNFVNCDADSGTNCADTEIGFTLSNSAALNVADGKKLIIWAGDTLVADGTVTTSTSADGTDAVVGGDLLIQSGATLSMGTNALSVGGDYINSGTFSKSSGQTTTFTAMASGFDITPGAGNFENVIFNPSLWVAAGASGTNTLGYSSDGISWTGLGATIFTTSGYAVAWNGTRFVAGGGPGINTLAYSSDGITWTGLGATIFTNTGYAVAWNGTRFVAAGGPGTNTLAYSSDGINWTGLGATIFTNIGYAVAWNGTRFVAAGEGTNTLAYSSDGINWTGLGATIFPTSGYAVAWNGTRFVAGGGPGINTLAYSSDGITWTGLGATIFTNTGYAVAWNGTRFVAGGGPGTNTLAYSSDGINWTGLGATIFTFAGRAVAWNGTRFVAGGIGTNTLAYSSDGITWTGLGATIFTDAGYAVAWNGTRFVAAGGPGTNTLAYSSDGINWTGLGATIFTNIGYAVAWNGTRFVAAGEGTNTLAYSSDGINWTGLGATIFPSSGVGRAVASIPSPQLVPPESADGGWTFTAAANTDGNFTITNGTVTAPSTTLTIAGNFTNNGTFTHNSGTVTFNDDTKTSQLTYSAATTFYSFSVSTSGKAMQFDETDQTNITYSITLQGGNCDSGRIFLDSTADDDRWDINYTGTTGNSDIDYVDVEDSNAVSALTAENSTADNDNNSGLWTINAGDCGAGGITVSGNAYENETSSALIACDGFTTMISLRVGGVTYGPVICADSDGAFSFSSVTQPSAGTPMIFWIGGATCSTSGNCASTVNRYSGSTPETGIELRKDRLMIMSGSGNVTNANLGVWDNVDDSDVIYDANDVSNNLTLEDGYKFIVNSGDTYEPGAEVITSPASSASSTDGDILIESTAVMTVGTNAVSCGGDWENQGTFTKLAGQTTTFTATGSGFTITDGGSPFYNITFSGTSGEWFYKDGANGINQTSVTAGTPTYLNTKRGTTVSVTGGTLNIDWYLGVKVVDAGNVDNPVDTGPTDITISENTSPAVQTVWKWSGGAGGGWGSPLESQTTGTDINGKIPQPGTDGAIRIREYSKTAAITTYYKYNLYITWQTSYGEYDYWAGYDEKYIISCDYGGAGCSNAGDADDVVGDNWKRASAGTQNDPAQSLDGPPTNGTWYNGMIIGLEFTIASLPGGINFGSIEPGASPTNQTDTITVATSASKGYIVYTRSTNVMSCDNSLLCDSDTISDWGGNNDTPTNWATGTGLGYKTSDLTLTGGQQDRFDGPFCGVASGIGCWAGFSHTGPGDPVADRLGPTINVNGSNIITYRLAASSTTRAGPYKTTVIFVVVAQY